jgi:transposase, IS5 family
VRAIGQTARAKSQGADRLKPGYKKLLDLAEGLLARARQLLQALAFSVDQTAFALDEMKNGLAPATRQGLLLHYMTLTEKVCANARRRVLQGEALANDEKIFSIFEPHTELIIRGKQPVPIQFGHNVLVVEDAVGFVVEYRVVGNGVLDQDLVVPVMKELQERFGGKIKSASFDRAFHTPENQKDLAEIVRTPCIASKGQEKGRQQQKEGTVAFRKARQNHPGVESAIGALQAGNGLKRCRDRSKRGYERYVALGILGRNLQTLGKLLLAQDEADCQAATSKRKRKIG